jgi:hypothetical protein
VETVALPRVVAPLDEEDAPERPPVLDPCEPAPAEPLVLDSSPPGAVLAGVPQWTSQPAHTQRTQAAALARAAARDATRNLPGRRIIGNSLGARSRWIARDTKSSGAQDNGNSPPAPFVKPTKLVGNADD